MNREREQQRVPVERSLISELRNSGRKRQAGETEYINTQFILPTSNMMERLFSRCRHSLNDYRAHLEPVTF